MGLDISKMLTPSRAPFYGIVSGNTATPLVSVVLPVMSVIDPLGTARKLPVRKNKSDSY
jgi:hypothetical protein